MLCFVYIRQRTVSQRSCLRMSIKPDYFRFNFENFLSWAHIRRSLTLSLSSAAQISDVSPCEFTWQTHSWCQHLSALLFLFSPFIFIVTCQVICIGPAFSPFASFAAFISKEILEVRLLLPLARQSGGIRLQFDSRSFASTLQGLIKRSVCW